MAEAGEVCTSLVEFAESLADAAGATIRRYLEDEPVSPSRAGPGSKLASGSLSVTAADLAADEVMRRMIKTRYPTHRIYCDSLSQVDLEADYIWVLDLMDGTKSLITGKPMVGTTIALLQAGRPVVGVLDGALTGERWVGSNGHTMFNGRVLRTRKDRSLSQATLYTTGTSKKSAPTLAQLCSDVKVPFEECDCYAYAALASGLADLIVERGLELSDYCALVPIVEGAGGRMSDWSGRDLTLQTLKMGGGRIIAAASRDIWEQALETLRGNSKAKVLLKAEKPKPALGLGGWTVPEVSSSVAFSVYVAGVTCCMVAATLASRRSAVNAGMR